jgi:hypothetical protein
MRRELAKDGELVWHPGFYGFANPDTDPSHFCTSAGKKMSEVGEVASHKLRPDRGRYQR